MKGSRRKQEGKVKGTKAASPPPLPSGLRPCLCPIQVGALVSVSISVRTLMTAGEAPIPEELHTS